MANWVYPNQAAHFKLEDKTMLLIEEPSLLVYTKYESSKRLLKC